MKLNLVNSESKTDTKKEKSKKESKDSEIEDADFEVVDWKSTFSLKLSFTIHQKKLSVSGIKIILTIIPYIKILKNLLSIRLYLFSFFTM